MISNWDTYTCGWDGSSPSDTESPVISLKHFWQKVYLSETRAGVGFLEEKKIKTCLCVQKRIVEIKMR